MRAPVTAENNVVSCKFFKTSAVVTLILLPAEHPLAVDLEDRILKHPERLLLIVGADTGYHFAPDVGCGECEGQMLVWDAPHLVPGHALYLLDAAHFNSQPQSVLFCKPWTSLGVGIREQ